MRRLALAVLAALAAPACRKAPAAAPDGPPVVAVVGGEELIDFDGADGSFRCRAPARWKALEFKDGAPAVMMIGPMSGPGRGKSTISVSRYDGVSGTVRTPREYWEAMRLAGEKPSPLETRTVAGRTAYALHLERPQYPPHGWKVLYMNREDVVLIPAGKGFFALSHKAPIDAYQATLAVFEAVVASFTPKAS